MCILVFCFRLLAIVIGHWSPQQERQTSCALIIVHPLACFRLQRCLLFYSLHRIPGYCTDS